MYLSKSIRIKMIRGLLLVLKDSGGKQFFMPGFWSGQSRSFDIPRDKKPPPDKQSHPRVAYKKKDDGEKTKSLKMSKDKKK